MESLQSFMNWVRDPASQIDLSVNQMWSLPFYTRKNKVVYLVLFSYTVSATHAGVNDHPDNVFYFDRKSSSRWFRQRLLPEYLPPVRPKIFMNAPALKGYTSAHREAVYDYLVTLTDRIMEGSFSEKMLRKYAMGVNTITPPDLVPYYLYLGGDYFDWVRRFFDD